MFLSFVKQLRSCSFSWQGGFLNSYGSWIGSLFGCCCSGRPVAIFSEERPSCLQWCLLYQHRHVLARCLMELQAGCRFPFGYDSAFLAYVDMLYGRLELRFGPLSQQGPEEARHWFPRLDFLFSAALSRNDEVLHCGTALSANPSSGSDYDISSVPLWTWRV